MLLHVFGKLLLSSRWSGASSRWLAWRLERDDVPAQASHPLEEPYLQKSQPSLETVWSKQCQHERYCCMLDCSRCLRLPTMRRSEKRPAPQNIRPVESTKVGEDFGCQDNQLSIIICRKAQNCVDFQTSLACLCAN